jgi:hypothetical protein
VNVKKYINRTISSQVPKFLYGTRFRDYRKPIRRVSRVITMKQQDEVYSLYYNKHN